MCIAHASELMFSLYRDLEWKFNEYNLREDDTSVATSLCGFNNAADVVAFLSLLRNRLLASNTRQRKSRLAGNLLFFYFSFLYSVGINYTMQVKRIC